MPDAPREPSRRRRAASDPPARAWSSPPTNHRLRRGRNFTAPAPTPRHPASSPRTRPRPAVFAQADRRHSERRLHARGRAGLRARRGFFLVGPALVGSGVQRVSVAGSWWRQTPHGADPLWLAFPPSSGRWQRGSSITAIYLADEEETAWAEWYRVLAEIALPPTHGMPRDRNAYLRWKQFCLRGARAARRRQARLSSRETGAAFSDGSPSAIHAMAVAISSAWV
jgi:hypothetical protein